MRLVVIVLAVVLSAGAAYAASEQRVEIRGLEFTPVEVRVAVGDSVTWANLSPETHTVTSQSDDERFDSRMLGSGGSFTHTFRRAGSFDFQCNVHPRMVGTVIVAEAATLPATGAAGAGWLGVAVALGFGLAALGWRLRRRAI